MITRPLNLLLFLCVTTLMLVAPAMADDDKKEDEPKKYKDVITDDAETDEGMFKVHRLDGKLFFEIPENLFGRDMLLVSRIAKVPAELAGGFMAAGHKTGEQVLRWEMVDEKVLVRKVSFERVADENTAIHKSVVNNNFFPILASFEIQVEGPKMKGSKTQVIDVTDFYQEDVPAISGLSQSIRKRYKVKSLDKNRSFLNYARAYPENVDVRSTLTFKADEPPVESNTETISLEMHQSMVLLPEEPMRRRYADRRVGWFTYEEVNFGLDKQKAATQEFLSRWRLEPKDEKSYARGELVEPKKQIVYYLDPGTPEKWAPYVKQGVEDWNVAFETAGFKNAIVAKEAPNDEEWTGEDVRYSVVRWAATEYRNAMGPSVADPRSGEIIESDIVWYHNHMKTYRNRLMLETGASNPLARSLPIDDELLGEALRQVIAHEIGHAIGLPHNMIASSAYPVASLRDPGFCREMGVSPSIMDYTRQNYIAQPGDGLVGSDYIRQIGPYDHYSVNWGYRWISDKTPIEEKPILDSWFLEKADDPMYRFSPQRGGLPVDPRAQTE
ncbi:MAG: DUF5117 domain-containing protein, partial [Candidatus Eisenbacteria bacterium]|nr:DUF5117 domain-containing protein [Candidatus Eisenbacteria bacterium]